MNIVQVNMTEIDISVTNIDINLDPGAAFIETDAAPDPVVAPTTVGPHRYTITVPHDDESIFHLGKGVDNNENKVKDTGIVGRTKTHIHFETREESPTIVSLGKFPLDEKITSYDAVALTSSEGYAMVTKGVAWNEAAEKFYIVSLEKDVTLRTKGEARAVLQSDKGHADVIAKETANMVATAINLSAPAGATPDTSKNYADPWTDKVPKQTHLDNWAHGTEIFAILSTCVDVFKEAVHLKHHWAHDSHVSKTKPLLSLVQLGATAVRTLMTAHHLLGELQHHEHPGTVKLSAASSVAAVAGSFAGVFGRKSATLGSSMFATMVAPYTALEGVLFSAMSGKRSSILGILGCEMSSPNGTITLDAKKDIAIGCEHGKVGIGGHEGVFLRSENGGASLHGMKRAYVGADEGDGYGLIATKDSVQLGQMTSANKLESAAFDSKNGLMMNRNSHIKMKWGSSEMTMESDKIDLTTGTVSLNAKSGDFVINGKTIHIG